MIVDSAVSFVGDNHSHENWHGQSDSNHGVQKVGVDEFQVASNNEIESVKIEIKYFLKINFWNYNSSVKIKILTYKKIRYTYLHKDCYT